ncbi:MAG: EAL domain-containing protein [Rhizobiaceae bacterium]
MYRPVLVGGAITKLDNGLQVGSYQRFTLYSAYQPIYRPTRSSALQLVGLEGLIRPYVDDVSLPPSLLYREIEDIDRHGVEQMCQSLHVLNYWAAAPEACDLFLNVNLANYASAELLERDLDALLGKLWINGLSAQTLVLEIVETKPCCEAILTALRNFAHENHVRIAIDDFSKGFSDIERYEVLKPDLVKIDGQVFARGTSPARESHMLQSIVSRVHGDGGKVVIEGIETPTMLAMALELEADLLQGSYLDAPYTLPYDFSRHHFPMQSAIRH